MQIAETVQVLSRASIKFAQVAKCDFLTGRTRPTQTLAVSICMWTTGHVFRSTMKLLLHGFNQPCETCMNC